MGKMRIKPRNMTNIRNMPNVEPVSIIASNLELQSVLKSNIEEIRTAKNVPIVTPEVVQIIDQTVTVVKPGIDKNVRKAFRLLKKQSEDSLAHNTFMLHKRMDMQAQSRNKLEEKINELTQKIQILEQRKPEEKHVLTEKTHEIRIEHKINKLVWVGIGAAIFLNLIALIK